MQRRFSSCLHLRHKLSIGAHSTCLRSLSLLLSFLGSHGISFHRIRLSRLASFIIRLSRCSMGPHSRTHVISKVGSFCRFLVYGSIVRIGPALLLRRPGLRQGLPIILALSRVRQVRSTVSLSGSRKRHGLTVIRVLCNSNLHIDRLVGLGLDSCGPRRHFYHMINGNGGRQLIPLDSRTVGRIKF